MVAQERAPSKDREIEGSNPLQFAFLDVGLQGSSFGILESAVVLGKARISSMLGTILIYSPSMAVVYGRGGTNRTCNARIEGASPV